MILTHECYIPGTDAELCVEFEYSIHRAAKISGPVENCHPEEGGEVELLSVHITSYDILEILCDKTQERLKDICGTWAREAQAAGEL
jgi:hypothetical protein